MLRMGGRFWYLKYQSLECPHRRQKYLEDINYAFQVTDCLAFNSHFIREESFRLFDELAIPYKSAETVVDIGVCPIIGTQESNLHNGLKKSDDELIISCVGKFKKFSKRQDLLVEAFARLPDCSNLRLVFAGDGPEMEAVRSIAKDRGVEQRVEFLGSISQADVYKLLELSDVFVHPTEFEGSSKAVAEAMSVGAAVLASNIPPNAEHISHEGNGLLAENTIESFLEQLQRICSDEPLRNELSASALNYAQDHFRPEINALHYQALFYELCRSGKLSKLKNKRRFVA
jgi:glycosyltransferase involved in cell wall biosynthesis